MPNIIPFSFENHSVRSVVIGGQPWFVAQDILDSLEYAESSKPAKVIACVPDEWRGVKQIHTLGGKQCLACISEQGLYFFLGRSDKPKALPFQKWLAGQVLPAIRKTGSYTHPAVPQPNPNVPLTIEAARLLLHNARVLMTVGSDGQLYIRQLRNSEILFDAKDFRSLNDMIYDMSDDDFRELADVAINRIADDRLLA